MTFRAVQFCLSSI